MNPPAARRRGRARYLLAAGLGLGLLASACQTPRQPTAPSAPAVTTAPARAVSLPAEIAGRHFFVVTRWDKNGPWRFLIDTGSSVTLVSPEFARRYATDESAADMPAVRVRSADGESILLTGVKLGSLSLGPARFDRVTALVYDFSDLSAHFGFKIDGLLGFPFFRDVTLGLDYPGSQLVLAPPDDPAPPQGVAVTFDRSRRTPLIEAQLGGRKLPLLIDSGSDGVLNLNPDGLDPRYAAGPRPGVTVSTLTGDRQQEIGRLDADLALAGTTVTKPVVELTDQLSSVGGGILGHFRITFDQRRGLATFAAAAPGPIILGAQRSCGLSFRKTPAYWRVLSVVPGSPADEAGLESGDLVTRINGERVEKWDLRRFETQVDRAPALDFTLLNGRVETTVRLATFDLVP